MSGSRDAVIYARVSSKEQEKEGFSIPAQLKLLRAHAADAGIHVAEEFVDVETAKQVGRARFGQMVAFLKKTPSCRVVLVEKTDRLYRNLKDWVLLDELDLEIHLVKENVVLSPDSRSSEKFMHGIKVLMAKNYIDNLSEEACKGMLEKASQGIWPSFAPLGYRNVLGKDGKRIIEPDPEAAPLVVKVFEWYASGDYGLREVAEMACKAGVAFRRMPRSAPRATIHKLLRNPVYMGEFTWKGITYQGSHEPLVSRETWHRVQEMLDGRFRNRQRAGAKLFTFARLVRCGHCGDSLVGEVKKGRYVYYHCSQNKGRCPEAYIREEVLEQRLHETLRELFIDDEVMAWIRQALHESHDDEKRAHDAAVAALQDELKALQGRLDQAYEDKLDGRIDDDLFDRKSREWRLRQRDILRRLEAHTEASAGYVDKGVALLELARKAHTHFATDRWKPSGTRVSAGATPAVRPGRGHEIDVKRQILKTLDSNFHLKGGRVHATWRHPLDAVAVAVTMHAAKKAANRNSRGAASRMADQTRLGLAHSRPAVRSWVDPLGPGRSSANRRPVCEFWRAGLCKNRAPTRQRQQ